MFLCEEGITEYEIWQILMGKSGVENGGFVKPWRVPFV
jgi:hypothetical protein